MTFTAEETRQAEKYIEKLEKDVQDWPRTRWIALASSIVALGLAFYVNLRLEDLLEVLLPLFTIQDYGFDPEGVELYVQGHVTSLRLEMIVRLGILLQLGIAAWTLTYCFMRWDRDIRSALLAKTLRKAVAE